MPIQHSLWTVSANPTQVETARLPSEEKLREMIVAEPRILSSDWMLVGREVDTGISGRIDLLAMAPDASLVIVELKRDRTPRDVVAQALDYAAWVGGIDADAISAIYRKFKPGGNLAADFAARFGEPLDNEAVNSTHQIVIVAASLDVASERIVNYLSERGIAINVLFFQVFQHDEQQLLGRAWLIDPARVQVQSASSSARGEREEWNREFYVSFGSGGSRRWDEARTYGFISGGGGTWYTNTLSMLSPGDRVWVKVPGKGFVGVGRVKDVRQSARDFQIEGRPALEVLQGNYHREFADDPDNAEYFVPVEWIQTVAENEACQEPGMFGNQNTVCKPRTSSWRTTVDKLKMRFGISDDGSTG